MSKPVLSTIRRIDREALAETIAAELSDRLSDAIAAEVVVDRPVEGDELWRSVCRNLSRMVVTEQLGRLTMAEAQAHVIADVRQSYGPDEMTDAECIEHVRNTVSVNDLDDTDELVYRAYLMVLATDPAS